MKKIKYKKLKTEEQKQLFNKICDDIIQKINEYRTMFNEKKCLDGVLIFNYDLTDIGDFTGKEFGQNTCENKKDLNIWAYDKDSFVMRFYHGYSLHDVTH